MTLQSLLLVAGLVGVSAQTVPQQPRVERPAIPARDNRVREPLRGTAILRGFVVAADNGSPLRRAQVRVSGQGVPPRLATTDAQGRFEIKELPAGRYTMTATKAGFVTLQYGQRRPTESGTPIDLGESQVREKIVIGLPRGSVISGRVTDEFGEPVAQAAVAAMRYGYAAGTRRLLPGIGQSRDTTDDQGHFRLFGLAPGEYVVSAGLRTGNQEITDPAEEATGYAPTYYPGTPNVGEAQRVTVGVGQEQSGVIFALIAARLVRVTGTVLDSKGTPVTRGFVTMSAATRAAGAEFTRQAALDGAGQFRLANVAPGRYVAQVRGRGAAVEAEFGRQEVTVGADDLQGSLRS